MDLLNTSQLLDLGKVVIWILMSLLTFYFSWTVAVSCALGSRLLLNMRETYFREKRVLLHGTLLSQTGMELDSVRRAHTTHEMPLTTVSLSVHQESQMSA
jgi:hypothetical protein